MKTYPFKINCDGFISIHSLKGKTRYHAMKRAEKLCDLIQANRYKSTFLIL